MTQTVPLGYVAASSVIVLRLVRPENDDAAMNFCADLRHTVADTAAAVAGGAILWKLIDLSGLDSKKEE